MNCEFVNPKIINTETGALEPLKEFDNDKLQRNSTVVYSGIECENEEAGSRIIEKNGNEVYYQESVTTGDFLVASIGIFIVIILFIDLIERRVIPRFVRFWK